MWAIFFVTGCDAERTTFSGDKTYYWSAGPALPEPVQEIYPAVYGDAIYVVGGLRETAQGFTVSDRVYRLTSQSDEWERLSDFPVPVHHAMLVSAEGTLWAFGGFTGSIDGQWNNSSTVYAYDQNADRWTKVGSMPVKLSESISAVINGNVHLAGGRTTDADNYAWQHHLDSGWHGVYDAEGGVWKSAAALPTPRNSACSVVVKGKWHVIGGRDVENGNTGAHEVFDPETDTWQVAKPMPEAQAGIGCVVYHNNIYVFGGEFFDSARGGVYYKVWRYEINRERWQDVSVMPVPRHGLGVVTMDDAIWLIGGASKAGAKETRNTVSLFRQAEQPARQ
nr:kelch repeat-containing protein [Aestuariibacter sp. A3R04]